MQGSSSSEDYVELEQKKYRAELLEEVKKIHSGRGVNCGRVCCLVTRINIVRFVGRAYDCIVYWLLVALDMYSDEEVEEVSVALPSRRVRGWYVIFGFAAMMLSGAMMIVPKDTLKFLGWAEEGIDTTCTRLLAATLAALALTCIRSGNAHMPSYHVLVADAAALVCAAFVIAIINVVIANSEAFDVGNVVTLCFFMGVAGAWMYCRGYTSASSAGSGYGP